MRRNREMNMNCKVSALIGQLVLTTTLVGCASLEWPSQSPLQLTVDDYVAAAPKVSLGMTKAQVVETLQPTQARLRNTGIKQPDMYTKDGVLVEILYFRSSWQNDHFTTDDEFTPYVFKDGKLVAVGWVTLGGPKSQAQARSKASENTTILFLPIHD